MEKAGAAILASNLRQRKVGTETKEATGFLRTPNHGVGCTKTAVWVMGYSDAGERVTLVPARALVPRSSLCLPSIDVVC